MNNLPLIANATTIGVSLMQATSQEEARAVIGAGTGGGGSGGAVDSVNGKTGAVVLTAVDVGAATAAQGAKADTALQPGDAPGNITSVNGKVGVVVLNASDVGALPTSAAGTTLATLVGGVIPNSQVPPLAITSTFVVNSEAAQLALASQEGDVCVRTDLAVTYIRLNSNLGTMLDWQILLSPTAPVQSVNGKTGVVQLIASDVGAATSAQGAKADTAVQPSSLGTAASRNIGSSGAAVPLLNENHFWDGSNTFGNTMEVQGTFFAGAGEGIVRIGSTNGVDSAAMQLRYDGVGRTTTDGGRTWSEWRSIF